MAGLLASIFQGSPEWRTLAIETGLAGAQGSRPVLTTQLMTSWFHHNHIVRKKMIRKATNQVVVKICQRCSTQRRPDQPTFSRIRKHRHTESQAHHKRSLLGMLLQHAKASQTAASTRPPNKSDKDELQPRHLHQRKNLERRSRQRIHQKEVTNDFQ
jgi:hypothetical protein